MSENLKTDVQAPDDPSASLQPLVRRHLRKAILIKEHGTPQEQKDALVEAVLEIAQCPDKWPLTDSERMDALRKFYQMALRIRETEAACAAS